MAEHLYLRRETTDACAADRAGPGEARGRIWPSAALSHLVDPVAVLVESDRMHVDLATDVVHELEAHRRAATGEAVAERFQRRDQFRRLVERGYEIEIVVRARLLAEERVDAPAAVEPSREAGGGDRIEQPSDLFRGHVLLRRASAP